MTKTSNIQLFESWRSKDLEAFTAALKEGCDTVSVCYEVDYRPVLHALAESDQPGTELFLSTLLEAKAPKNEPHNGLSPIHRAVKNKNVEALKLLIKHGVDVNTRDIYGNTPLHYCAKSKWSEDLREKECANLLLEQPEIDINAVNHLKEQPLHNAIDVENTEFIDMLLDNSESLILDEEPRIPTLRERIVTSFPNLITKVESIPVKWATAKHKAVEQENQESSSTNTTGEGVKTNILT